jgi:hypothetical protein
MVRPTKDDSASVLNVWSILYAKRLIKFCFNMVINDKLGGNRLIKLINIICLTFYVTIHFKLGTKP